MFASSHHLPYVHLPSRVFAWVEPEQRCLFHLFYMSRPVLILYQILFFGTREFGCYFESNTLYWYESHSFMPRHHLTSGSRSWFQPHSGPRMILSHYYHEFTLTTPITPRRLSSVTPLGVFARVEPSNDTASGCEPNLFPRYIRIS
jgi:hypothetical protein